MKILILIVVLVVIAGLWVRFAPFSASKWHIAVIDPNAPKRIGYLAKINLTASADDVLRSLDKVVRATPRTRVLAGSVDDGRITYITRSRLWGFPDYTTVWVEGLDEGSRLTLYGRLRFGYSDSGVNRYRIQAWLKVLESLQ